MALPFTKDQAVDVALFVLHHAPGVDSLKATQIVELALDPALRAFWVQKKIALPWLPSDDRHAFASQFALKLNSYRDNTPATKRIIDGQTSGWKLGHSAAKRLFEFVPSLKKPSTDQHLGLAGEYAVMSELLALNWSVAKPPFDDGVDLFATQDNKVRTVQVKTATLASLGDGVMTFSGSTNSLKHYDSISHYYVLVFRLIAGKRWQNSYYICDSNEFSHMLNSLRPPDCESKKWSLRIHRVNGRFLAGNSHDITDDLDRFDKRFK